MKILIIGGTRFIGPKVVRKLFDLDHEIILFHRGISRSNICDSLFCMHGDRAKLLDYKEALRKLEPDIVLDMIPVRESDAQDVVKVFNGIAQRVVCISSQDVYRAYGVLIGIERGSPDPIPITEDAPLRSVGYPYRDRVESDHILFHYDKIPIEETYMGNPDFPGTILRLPMVYGPGDYQHRIFPYLKRMDDGRKKIILEHTLANWRWTKGYVEDTADGIVLAVTDPHAAGRIYNIGEKTALNEREWVSAIGRAVGWAGEIAVLPNEILPDHLKSQMNTKQQMVIDTNRIRDELGFIESTSHKESIKRTIEWERLNPPESIDSDQFNYNEEDELLGDV